MVECKYRGRVIGWLVTGADGFPAYFCRKVECPTGTMYVTPLGEWSFQPDER